jgi:excinuclease ABC subunit C
VILPRTSEALYLLQRVRDEAHRFAITFHRERRSKRMTTSRLDSVPGLGEIRKKALLTRFGSVKRLSAASADEIASVPGIGERTAAAIVAALGGDAPPNAPSGTVRSGDPRGGLPPAPDATGIGDLPPTPGGTGTHDGSAAIDRSDNAAVDPTDEA